MRNVRISFLILLIFLSASNTFAVIAFGERVTLSNFSYNSLLSDIAGGPADAGSDQDVCNSQITTLDGNDPAPGTGEWSVDSGPGNVIFDNPNQFDTQVSVDQYGSYILIWTVDDGTVTTDDVTVNFYEQPVADAGSGGDECDLDFVLNATGSAGTGTWTMTGGTGTASFLPGASDPNATVEVSDYGTKEFTWTEVNGSCSDAAAVTVNFYEQPVADAGSGGDECDLDYVLNATGSAGTGTWTMTGGTGTASFLPGASDPNATVEVSDYGTKEFTWTEVNGSCSDAAAVTVNFNEQPVADAGSGGDECDLDFVLNATGSAGTGTWTMTGGTGTASFLPGASDPNATVEVSDYGTKEFTWTEVNGSCSDAARIAVSFYRLPEASISGSTEVCQGGLSLEITITGSSGIEPYTFTYTVNGGSLQTVTTVSGNSIAIPVSTETPGSYVYELKSVKDSSPAECEQIQNGTATVTVNPLPQATIAGTTSICQLSGSTDIVFTGSNGTAPYSFSYTVNSGPVSTITTDSGNSVNIPVSGDNAGTYTYTLLSVSDASSTACERTVSGSATVTVLPLPEADISGSTTVCQDSPSPEITFTGSNGTEPYTFTYSVNSGPQQTVSTSAGNSVNLPVPTTTPGVYVHELISVKDGSSENCENIQAGDATVTINPLPEASISGSAEVCQLSPFPLITFTGTNGTGPYTFTYTLNGGSPQTINSGQADTAQVAVPTDNTGVFIYDLLSVSDASITTCSQIQTGTAEVTVISVPQGTITGSTAVCQEDPSPEITFTGTSGTSPYTFTYTVNDGPEQTITTTSGNSVNLAVQTSIPGTYTYNLVMVQDAGTVSCSNSESGIAIIQVDEMPLADAGTDAEICGLSHELSGFASTGTGTWTMTNGAGTATFSPDASDPNATVELSEYGSKEFTWTVVNGLCSDTATVEVSFYNQLQANGGDGGEECDLDFVLKAVPGPGTGSWSLLNGPGQAVFSPSTSDPGATVTVDTTGLYEFLWTEQNQFCQSSDIVEVQFRDLPELYAGNDTLMCKDASVQLEAIGEGIFRWEPAVSLDNDTIYNPVAGPDTTTTYTVRLTDQYGCINYDDITVEVFNQVMANAGPDQTLEYTFETELNARLGERESGIWELIRGSGTIDDTSAAATTITELSLGENVLIWTVTNGVCPESADYLRIYVNELLIPSLITPNRDGRNDFFVLQGIQNLGQTGLVVFDRSGVKVYENSDYDNNWDGTDQKGNPLPEDTYFYVIRPSKGNSQSGYIVIRR
ncbi:MAG: gliding motility-associated C-terminal domain-containing protein [Bacteroidales bacterium]|nr:gliding motility-associated C-terminal domain-containing protein [Bacteroidales bacterium]